MCVCVWKKLRDIIYRWGRGDIGCKPLSFHKYIFFLCLFLFKKCAEYTGNGKTPLSGVHKSAHWRSPLTYFLGLYCEFTPRHVSVSHQILHSCATEKSNPVVHTIAFQAQQVNHTQIAILRNSTGSGSGFDSRQYMCAVRLNQTTGSKFSLAQGTHGIDQC